jgi:hypothetical protein
MHEFCLPQAFSHLEANNPVEAFRASEAARTLALRLSQIDRLEFEHRQLEVTVSQLEGGMTAVSDPVILARMEADLSTARARLGLLQRVCNVAPSVSDILSEVREGDLFLSWLVGEEQTILFAVSRMHGEPATVEAVVIEVGSEPQWEPEGEPPRLTKPSWSSLIRPLRSPWSEANSTDTILRDLLFPQAVRELIRQSKWVHLVPDGDLMELPMWALRDEDGDLIFGEKTPDLPLSLTSWAASRMRARADAGDLEILYGINDYGEARTEGETVQLERIEPPLGFKDDFRRGRRNLKHAVPEVEQIAKLHGLSQKDHVRTDKDANKQSLKREWRSARWLHLAMHGRVDLRDVGQTELLLYEGNQITGLTLNELISDFGAGQDIGVPEVVFLSACFSAAGGVLGAEGRMSVAYALIHAGVRCVVAVQWAANDLRAKEQMCATHELLVKGYGVSEALAIMQSRERTRPGADARDWAMFVAYGDGSVNIA